MGRQQWRRIITSSTRTNCFAKRAILFTKRGRVADIDIGGGIIKAAERISSVRESPGSSDGTAGLNELAASGQRGYSAVRAAHVQQTLKYRTRYNLLVTKCPGAVASGASNFAAGCASHDPRVTWGYAETRRLGFHTAEDRGCLARSAALESCRKNTEGRAVKATTAFVVGGRWRVRLRGFHGRRCRRLSVTRRDACVNPVRWIPEEVRRLRQRLFRGDWGCLSRKWNDSPHAGCTRDPDRRQRVWGSRQNKPKLSGHLPGLLISRREDLCDNPFLNPGLTLACVSAVAETQNRALLEAHNRRRAGGPSFAINLVPPRGSPELGRWSVVVSRVFRPRPVIQDGRRQNYFGGHLVGQCIRLLAIGNKSTRRSRARTGIEVGVHGGRARNGLGVGGVHHRGEGIAGSSAAGSKGERPRTSGHADRRWPSSAPSRTGSAIDFTALDTRREAGGRTLCSPERALVNRAEQKHRPAI
ncbi:hypothetical protein MRX96_005219 [Rhipicephalus microplus]